MTSSPDPRCPDSSRASERIDRRQRRPSRGAACGLALCVCLASVATLMLPASALADPARTATNPEQAAVVAPSARFTTVYSFERRERTSAPLFEPGVVTEFRIPDSDGHTTTAVVSGTAPLGHRLGVRGTLRAGYFWQRSSKDVFGSGHVEDDSYAYGGAAQIFVRHPEIGSFAVGPRFDRFHYEDGFNSNDLGATASGAIFFPDFGNGPVEWFARFDYVNSDLSGPGLEVEFDSDLFSVTGGARWYPGDRLATSLGGSWTRIEDDLGSIERSEGSFELSWLIPLRERFSLELDVGASIGQREVKNPPFRADKSWVYGASLALTLRLSPGMSLVALERSYD